MSKAKVFFILAAIVAGFMFFRPTETTIYSHGRLSFSYPTKYTAQTKPVAQLGQAEALLRLLADNPFRNISLDLDKNALRYAQATKTDFLDYLENNASSTLPQIYRQYKKFKAERIEISGYEAVLISFRYLGADKKTLVYTDLFLIPIDNDGYYLTMESFDQAKLAQDTKLIRNSLQID